MIFFRIPTLNWPIEHTILIVLGHKRLFGSRLGTQVDLERLVYFVETGRLNPVIAREYSLADTAQMMGDTQSRDLVRKLVVRPQR